MIERRSFKFLSDDRSEWLQAEPHFSPADPNSGRSAQFGLIADASGEYA
jgi:hypothetical protein